MAQKIETTQELHQQLGKIITNGPLYSAFIYEGRGAHQAPATPSSLFRSSSLPTIVKMYCDDTRCKQETLWKADNPNVNFGQYSIDSVKYQCRNCGDHSARYYFIWQERDHDSIFIKVGQYPEL